MLLATGPNDQEPPHLLPLGKAHRRPFRRARRDDVLSPNAKEVNMTDKMQRPEPATRQVVQAGETKGLVTDVIVPASTVAANITTVVAVAKRPKE